MTVIAAADTHTLWWITLGMGLVVVLVVVVLMVLLLSFVQDIARAGELLLGTADQLSDDTSEIGRLRTTAGVLEDIKAEMLVHSELLRTRVVR